MKAMILAAGEGVRLRPYTLDRPKCLVEIEGKSLLDCQLEVLRSQGLNDIVIVKGYRADIIDRPGTRTYINPRYYETNMVWTLFCARQEFTGSVIVSYGDIVYSREVLRSLLACPHDVCVVVDKAWKPYWQERHADPLRDAETLRIDDIGRIVDIGQRPKTMEEIQGQYIGLTKFTEKGLSLLETIFDNALRTGTLDGKAVERAYMTDILQAIIKSDYDVWPVFIEGGWVEVDTVNDLFLEVTRRRFDDINREATPQSPPSVRCKS